MAARMRRFRGLLVGVAMMAGGPMGPCLGCEVADPLGGGDGAGPMMEEAETASTGGTTGAPAPRPPVVSGGESSGDDGVAFLMEPDGGTSLVECDVYSQDCPDGQRCGLWLDAGNDVGSRCMQLVPDPARKGEACHYEGGFDGRDDCDIGLTCWDLDAEGYGVCVAMCTGDSSNPTCEDPNDVCVGKSALFCFPRCFPLDDNCPAGCGCYPLQDDFGCLPDASGDMGGYGDPCEFINVCDPGHVCLAAEAVPDCAGGGCCTPFCDLGMTACPDALECVPWFEEGSAPPWYENLGACVLPQ